MADEKADPQYDDDGKVIEVEGAAPAPKEEEKKEGEPAPKAEEKEEGEEKAEESEPDEDIEEDKIPTRNASHIIARKNAQIEKLKAKKDEEEEDEEEDDDKGVLQKQIDLLKDDAVSRTDEGELQDLIRSNPEAKKYEKRIRSHMKVWGNVPPLAIYRNLAFESAAKIGAKKKEIADKEAANLKGGGDTHRPKDIKVGEVPTAEEITAMSDEEFDKLDREVEQGKFTE